MSKDLKARLNAILDDLETEAEISSRQSKDRPGEPISFALIGRAAGLEYAAKQVENLLKEIGS
jgi:hypothetical protein